MSRQPTLWDLPNATFSPGSASGPSPSALPAGPTIAPSGPAPAHANLSARQAKAMGLLTSGTYGPPGIGSLESVSLQKSSVSRLRAATQHLGSTLYFLTWKGRATPAGRWIFALRASVRRTSGKGSSGTQGWSTPAATDGERGGEITEGMSGQSLTQQAPLAGWPTPTLPAPHDSDVTAGRARPREGYGLDLPMAADLAGWPTPTVMDHTRGPESNEARLARGAKTGTTLIDAASMAGWASPQARDYKGSRTGEAMYEDRAGRPLNEQTANLLDGWREPFEGGPARLTASGELLIGSTAGMEAGGQLNPEHSLWLQGIPNAWASCAVRAMQSMRKSRRK